MHFSTTLLGILSITTLTLALPTDSIPTANNVGDCSICTNTTLPDYYEAIHQGEFRLADILDRKDYNSLGLAMTQDAIYDNSALPGGSVMKGLEEIKAKVAQAFGNSLVRHDVTTGKIDALDPTKAHVITYLIFSKWDPTALYDPTKTFRVYEKCDDIWVLDQGLWKLKYSKVTNMGPKAEAIYWGAEKA